MLAELIDFVDSILPSVSPDFRDGAIKAIEQFERDGRQINYLLSSPLSELSQGDFLSAVPFCYFDDDGKQKMFTADAMVLSTSCHIDQKGRIVLMPVLPLCSFDGKKEDLMKNRIFDFMYIPDATLADKYIDFECVETYSKDLIFSGLRDGSINRIASLNQVGYYMFIVKLTVYLMRKEDSGTLTKRNAEHSYN